MLLALPDRPGLQIREQAAVVAVRQVARFHVEPQRVALRWRQRRPRVHLVLEVIDRGYVRQKRDAVLDVDPLVALGVVAEEQVHPRVGQKLHRHRVDFRRLAGRKRELEERLVARAVALERVAALVGHDGDVVIRAVEVGEHERHALVGEVRAEPAAGLAVAQLEVEQLALDHHVEELADARVQLAVHGPGVLDDVGRVAARARIAGQVPHRLVVQQQRLDAQAPRLNAVEVVGQRHDLADQRVAKHRDLVGAVVRARHQLVAERRVAVVAQRAPHVVAQVDQPIVHVVELVAARAQECVARLLRLEPGRAVRVDEVTGDAAHAHRLAAELDLRARHHLLVRAGELRLLGEGVLDLRREGRRRALLHRDELGAEPVHQRVAVRRREQGAREDHVELAHHWRRFVPEILLGLGRVVGRVLLVADHRDVVVSVDVGAQVVPAGHDVEQPVPGRRGVALVGERAGAGGDVGEVGALVVLGETGGRHRAELYNAPRPVAPAECPGYRRNNPKIASERTFVTTRAARFCSRSFRPAVPRARFTG
jgi:hypothetical protein